jgi:phosphate starvation-inducible PhoH-like protein
LNGQAAEQVRGLLADTVRVPLRAGPLTPLTAGQKRYLEAIRANDIVFAIGPAGTGKTYLAVAMAVEALHAGRVKRIVLVRPVVEAGERLGFLPGDIAQKIDPYIRPLYDALYEMIEAERIREFIDEGVIEIAPLAYMRGRTLNGSFIIVDEAQNTSIEQMKMLLTRMGFDSRTVITGDVTQIDLPKDKPSGLVHSQKVLGGIEGIEWVHLSRQDVVRHRLVQRIIQAYEADGKKR